MNIRTDIICSECDVDLKDKMVMGETSIGSVTTLPSVKAKEGIEMSEKTLSDLIRNNQLDMLRLGSASIQGSPSPLLITAAYVFDEPHFTGSEIVGNEWVIPNKVTEEQILNGNEFNYIHMAISLKVPDCKVLVLCEVRKEYWSDGSYKRKYHPLSYSQLKRMPE